MAVSVIPTLDLERELAAAGYDIVCGIDEVGRGSLAGPVMVGVAGVWADSLSTREVPEHVADSKMLTEHRREQIFEPLCDWADAYAVGSATNHEIDDMGISHALGIAALRAIADVERQFIAQQAEFAAAEGTEVTKPLKVAAILDGPNDYITKALDTFDAPDVPIRPFVTTKVKGDQHCATISTAAVIAKVTRDRMMVELAEQPQYAPYEWQHNKGYGSKAHRAAIAEHGPSDLHRISWHLV